MRARNFALCSLLALAGGMLLGWTARSWHASKSSSNPEYVIRDDAGQVSPPVSTTTITPTPQASPGEITSREPALDAERYLREAGMRAIPAGSLDQFRTNPIQPDGTVSAAVIDLFSLGQDEVNRLNESLAATASALREMELARMEVVSSTDDELVLLISAFVEEGLAAEEDLRQSILQQLGEEDGALFWNLMKTSRGQFWGGFGRLPMEVAFRFEPRDGDSGVLDAVFAVTPMDNEAVREWFIAEGLQLGGHKNHFGPRAGPEYRVEALGRYGYLLPLLPEELRVSLGFE